MSQRTGFSRGQQTLPKALKSPTPTATPCKTDRYFVETNIFVYCRDSSDPAKHRIARTWISDLWSSGNGLISTQVLKEYYQVVTRRLNPGMSVENARADIRDLMTWKPIELIPSIFELAWTLEDSICIPWWDALIVAAASRSECN